MGKLHRHPSHWRQKQKQNQYTRLLKHRPVVRDLEPANGWMLIMASSTSSLDSKVRTAQLGYSILSSKYNPATTRVNRTDELTSYFKHLREQVEDQLEAAAGEVKRTRLHELSEEKNERTIMWKKAASAEPILFDKIGDCCLKFSVQSDTNIRNVYRSEVKMVFVVPSARTMINECLHSKNNGS